ncbi:hypothetical protein O3P69_011498 [Scylla paramamosain]|uniref:Schwannomin interacting protein 1 C-terminal domain-containing protein n=1 Tax=Scylla paramamosain TaxID=85552 RepID=A0AAW0T606_SCYPA
MRPRQDVKLKTDHRARVHDIQCHCLLYLFRDENLAVLLCLSGGNAQNCHAEIKRRARVQVVHTGALRSTMNIISRAVQPLRRLVKSDFDFSNMDDFQYDDEYDEEGEFDVYTMEAAMPKIDWDTIEAHLRATKEEERRRRNDREEIRRKLAMGLDEDQTTDRPHRKPSLHSRLQSGMNLQICFMNETASDCESQCSDTESTQDREVDSEQVSTTSANSKCSTPHSGRNSSSQSEADLREENFFARQAQLQQEARLALAQAKEMARMQMEIEKQSRKKSPIAEVVRASFNKIGVPFPDSKRRISRQILTDMNVAQLQVIVNDLHTQIESLNEDLVTFLMERDDLHMEQDSMLVDIEDLTKHIGAKELSLRGDSKDGSIKSLSVLTPPTKTKTNSMRLKGSSKK